MIIRLFMFGLLGSGRVRLRRRRLLTEPSANDKTLCGDACVVTGGNAMSNRSSPDGALVPGGTTHQRC
jgi:hypothetical protein